MAYNLPNHLDLPLAVVRVPPLFNVEVPDNVLLLRAPLATNSAVLPADVLVRGEVDVSVVHLNINSKIAAKGMADQVAAKLQEADSWPHLDFKMLRDRFGNGMPLQCDSSNDESEAELEQVKPPGMCFHLMCASPTLGGSVPVRSMCCQEPDSTQSGPGQGGWCAFDIVCISCHAGFVKILTEFRVACGACCYSQR